MQRAVSIIIPTKDRPGMLRRALLSALEQLQPACEILVGDDSRDPSENRAVIQHVSRNRPGPPIKHFDKPSGSQAANVSRLIQHAEGEWICLLHDDDLLLPNALQKLLRAGEEHRSLKGYDPVLIYGNQILINEQGEEDSAGSVLHNESYFRVAMPQADIAANPLLAAVVQQAPNNGYLADRKIAAEIGYDSDPSVGQACDFRFAIRLSKFGSFCYLPEAVTKYRLTLNSIGRGQGKTKDDAGLNAYLLLQRELTEEELAQPLVRHACRQHIKTAINQARCLGKVRLAWCLFFAADHFASILTPQFWFRGLRLLAASIRRDRKT